MKKKRAVSTIQTTRRMGMNGFWEIGSGALRPPSESLVVTGWPFLKTGHTMTEQRHFLGQISVTFRQL